MSHFSLQARWVLPVERPPIARGVVTIAGGKIAAVGNRSAGEGPLHDLGDVVLMPGLVNTHTHLEFSQRNEPFGYPGMPLPEWIRLVIANRQHAQKNVIAAIIKGLQESLRNGTTAIGDIALADLSVDESIPRPNLLSFQEAIGFSAARANSVLADIKQRIKKRRAPNSRDLTERRGPNTMPPKIGLSPHAPYTVHPRLLEQLVDLAREQDFPVAMHLAESSAELELLASSRGPFRELLEERSMWDNSAIPTGTKPMNYLKMLARAPRALVIHGNYLSPEEIQYLATQQEKMSVVYCPRTHAYFEHTAYPLQQMLATGVQVALGTDSRASNPDLSLLSEMRSVAQQHGQVAPEQILAMGTLAGAQALGWGDTLGSLAPGKWANLTAIACDAKSNEPEAAILHGTEKPTQTWLTGQRMYFLKGKPHA